MCSERRGFTLLEMMVTVSLMAVVGASVLPLFQDKSRLQLNAAANLVTSDIELAQVINVTAPAQHLILRFDPPNNRYWLAFAENPMTPVPAPGESVPYLVKLGEGRAAQMADVSFEIEGMADDALAFTDMGSLTDLGSAPEVILRSGDQLIRVMVSPSTGSITQE